MKYGYMKHGLLYSEVHTRGRLGDRSVWCFPISSGGRGGMCARGDVRAGECVEWKYTNGLQPAKLGGDPHSRYESLFFAITGARSAPRILRTSTRSEANVFHVGGWGICCWQKHQSSSRGTSIVCDFHCQLRGAPHRNPNALA